MEATAVREDDPLAAYMTEAQAATALSVTTRSLRAWRQKRQGPPWLRIGQTIYYRRSALTDWLRSIEVGPAKLRRSA